jgi:hypothetical protein
MKEGYLMCSSFISEAGNGGLGWQRQMPIVRLQYNYTSVKRTSIAMWQGLKSSVINPFYFLPIC